MSSGFAHLHPIDALCILISFLYLSLPYLHNTLCTKILYYDILTLDFTSFMYRIATFPFKNPIKLDIPILGGISTNILT